MNDSEKKRLTSSERDAVLRLCAAMAIIQTEPDKLTHRLSGMKFLKRDIGLMRKTIQFIVGNAIQSVPDNQLRSIKNDIHNTTYTVAVNKITATDTHNEKNAVMTLSYDTIYTLISGCHDKCLMCALDKGQRRACKLKKALDSIPNNIPDVEDGDCPYYGIV